MMKKLVRHIVAPTIGALAGWILLEPWTKDFGFFRDFMLFYFLALGIVLAVLCEQGIRYLKPKLFFPYLKNYKTYLIPLLGALIIKLVFTPFGRNIKCTQDDIKDQTILVLDTSGSMDGDALKELKASVEEYLFLLKCSNSIDQVAIVSFDSNAKVISDSSNDFDMLSKITENLRATGGTNMQEGLRLAYGLLPQFDLQTVTFILVSDGVPENIDQVKSIVQQNGHIKINTIGVGYGYDASLLKEISFASNGQFFPANDISKLTDIFTELAGAKGMTNTELSPLKRILGWTLLGLFIGITIGWIDKREGLKKIVLLGSVVGGFLSSLLFIVLNLVGISSGSMLRMISFGLFGLIIGFSIYFVNILFSKINTKSPL